LALQQTDAFLFRGTVDVITPVYSASMYVRICMMYPALRSRLTNGWKYFSAVRDFNVGRNARVFGYKKSDQFLANKHLKSWFSYMCIFTVY